MKQHYTLGFMFHESRLMMALVMKNRPSYQAGKLNGIGGKVEPGEDPLAAQRREFREETGVDHEEWDLVCVMEGEHFVIHCYRAFTTKVNQVQTKESEKIHLISVNQVRHLLISAPDLFLNNLQWLIPLMLDEGRHSADCGNAGVAPVGAKILY